MSTISTDLRATATARPAALRAADGLIAGYIRSLAREAAKPATQETTEPVMGRLMKQAHECGAGRRTSGIAGRRRPVLRRAPSPA